MPGQRATLRERIDSGEQILIAEVSPPKGSAPGPMQGAARAFAGKVHALAVSDNRDGARMSALAAASVVLAEGVEPILDVVTRDRNRLALVSTALGAMALGVRNVLCTSGTHQTLGRGWCARNVFDIDSVQLLQTYANLGSDGAIVGEAAFEMDGGPLCLGATAAPQADPRELQVVRLGKKIKVGAQFIVTEPVFDLERFGAWWAEVSRRGLHEKAAILVGIEALAGPEEAKAYAAKRPSPGVPDAMLERAASRPGAGMEIAVETVERLSKIDGLRGFQFSGERAAEVLRRTGLEAG